MIDPTSIHYKYYQKFINLIYKLINLVCLNSSPNVYLQNIIQRVSIVIESIMLIFPIILILFIQTSCIYQELQPLKPHFYNHIHPTIINLTSSEKLNITLPQISTVYRNSTVSVSSLQQPQFHNLISIGKTVDSDGSKSKNPIFQQEKGHELSDFGLECGLNEGFVSLSKQYSTVRTYTPNERSHEQFEDRIYVLVPTRSLLYSLKTQTMQLQVFHYSEHILSLLSEITIADTTVTASMAVNYGQDKVYIFTSQHIWSINTKTMLTDIRKLPDMGMFKTTVTNGFHKVIPAGESRFLGMKRAEAVYLFGQTPGSGSYKEITRYKDTRLIPQDVFIRFNKIYILDLHTGVYIFTLLLNGQIEEFSFIQLKTYSNSQFYFYQSTIFVLFNDPQSKIAEIHYNTQKEKGELVRYYKNNDFVTSINVFLTNNPQTQSKQPYLYLLSDQDFIQIYPFNIDAQMIQTLNNGPKMTVPKIRHIFQTQNYDFILITDEEIKYVKLQVYKPELVCKTDKTVEGMYRIQIVNNVSTCEDYNNVLFKHKNAPYEYCELRQNYAIYIRDPERTALQKIIFYGIIGGFCVLLMGGLMCLIHWRNNKIIILQRLKDQINKFRTRAKKLQPFTQEEQNSNEIDVQLPKIVFQENKPQQEEIKQ